MREVFSQPHTFAVAQPVTIAALHARPIGEVRRLDHERIALPASP